MPKAKIETVLDGLDEQIVSLTQEFFKTRRKAVEKAMLALKENMKKDLVRWSELLESGKLTPADYESLIASQAPTLKIALLEQVAVSHKKADGLALKLTATVAKAGIAAIKAA